MFKKILRKREDDLTGVTEAMDSEVKKITETLQKLAAGVQLTFTDKAVQYTSSEEIWHYYKGVRDRENFKIAFFTLSVFKRAVKEWGLIKTRRPTSSLFKQYKNTRTRYKKLADETLFCQTGIKYELLGQCLGEKIYTVEPLSGGKDKAPLADDSPSAKFLAEKFAQKFQYELNIEKFVKKFSVLRTVCPPPLRQLASGEKHQLPVVGNNMEENTNTVIGESDNQIPATKVSQKDGKFKRISVFRNTIGRKKRVLVPGGAVDSPITRQDLLKEAVLVTMVDSEFRNRQFSLKKNQYKLVRVRCDNHVLFRAFAHALSVGKCSAQHEARDIFKLREVACTELLKSATEPIMSDGTTVMDKMLLQSGLDENSAGIREAVSDYYRKMLVIKKGGVLEMWALSRALKLKVHVFEKVLKEDNLYLDHFKHLATYGTTFENEVFLYRNGRGSYGTLLERNQLARETPEAVAEVESLDAEAGSEPVAEGLEAEFPSDEPNSESNDQELEASLLERLETTETSANEEVEDHEEEQDNETVSIANKQPPSRPLSTISNVQMTI